MGRGALSRQIRSINRASQRGKAFRQCFGDVGFEQDFRADGKLESDFPCGNETIVKQIKHEGTCYVIYYLRYGEFDEIIQPLAIGKSMATGMIATQVKPIDRSCEEWNTICHKLAITLNVERAMKERK